MSMTGIVAWVAAAFAAVVIGMIATLCVGLMRMSENNYLRNEDGTPMLMPQEQDDEE